MPASFWQPQFEDGLGGGLRLSEVRGFVSGVTKYDLVAALTAPSGCDSAGRFRDVIFAG
jgi:hypothetical protein